MGLTLVNNIDFTWEVTKNPYGYEFNTPKLNSGNFLKRITSPNRGSIVYMYHSEDELFPVLIEDGQYLSNGRVSNFWYWKKVNDDFSLGENECGYGGFYESPFKFNIRKEVTITDE